MHIQIVRTVDLQISRYSIIKTSNHREGNTLVRTRKHIFNQERSTWDFQASFLGEILCKFLIFWGTTYNEDRESCTRILLTRII